MKQRLWWDMSKEKGPKVHSVKFLKKQAEAVEDRETGNDKFDLKNRPYYLPPDPNWASHKHLNVPTGKETYSEIEKGIILFSSRLGPVLKLNKPKKRKATTTRVGFKMIEIEPIDMDE